MIEVGRTALILRPAGVAIRGTSSKRCDFRPHAIGQPGPVLDGCQFPCPLGRLHGLWEAPSLGIGGRQRCHEHGIAVAGNPHSLLRQLDGPAAVSERGLRAGREHPGQTAARRREVGLDF